MRNNKYEYDQYEAESDVTEDFESGFTARVFGKRYQANARADWQRGWNAAADGEVDDE
jgi:hypothetical protein